MVIIIIILRRDGEMEIKWHEWHLPNSQSHLLQQPNVLILHTILKTTKCLCRSSLCCNHYECELHDKQQCEPNEHNWRGIWIIHKVKTSNFSRWGMQNGTRKSFRIGMWHNTSAVWLLIRTALIATCAVNLNGAMRWITQFHMQLILSVCTLHRCIWAKKCRMNCCTISEI